MPHLEQFRAMLDHSETRYRVVEHPTETKMSGEISAKVEIYVRVEWDVDAVFVFNKTDGTLICVEEG